jgi:hypothetical protein
VRSTSTPSGDFVFQSAVSVSIQIYERLARTYPDRAVA